MVDDLERTTSLSEPPPAVEPLPLSRAARAAGSRGSRWLLGLGLGGLLLVPIVGTVYLSVADFSPSEATAVSSGATGKRVRAPAGPASVDDDEAAEPADPRARPGTRDTNSARRGAEPRTDAASLCCAKLRELGKGAPLDSRASFLAAATACDAAPSEDRAFKQVQSVLGGSRVEIPDECARD